MQHFFKVLLLLILFAPIFILSFKHKKWYLYLACAFVGVLPDTFAVQLSANLPLLTAERILILILFGAWILKKSKYRSFVFPVTLLVYCSVNILISLVNTHFGLTEEIKRIAVLVIEQVMLVILISDMIETREEFDKCIDAVILSCCALSVIGIFQTIFNFDVTTVLHLVEARSDIALTHRMGMTRAFGTSNAIILGCYCAFTSLLIYYRLERTGRQRYAIAFALDIVALICTYSRSSWLCFAALGCLLLFMRPRKLIRRIWSGALIAALLCVSLSFSNSGFTAAFIETGKATLNTVLGVVNIQLPTAPNPDENPPYTLPSDSTDPTDPMQPEDPDEEIFQFELSEKFGLNANSAALSRFVEWTAFLYMWEEGHCLFGYGYNAFMRGRLHYFYPQFGFWNVAGTLDVGLLRIVTESGIIGLLAHLALLGYIFISAFLNRGKNGTLTFNKLLLYLIPLYFLLNFMAAFSSILWIVIALFYSSKQLDSKGLWEDGTPASDNQWIF